MGSISAQPLSDEELVVVIRERDQEQFAELVERYQQPITRYVLYLLRDADKAHDAVQSAFIKAFTNLRGFDTSRKFSSWLYRIAHNEAINLAKQHRWQVSLEAESWIAERIPGEHNVAQEVSDAEVRASTRAVVEQLPLKYREPLVLFYFNDLSYEEISDVLHLPVGTVGTRINRAKKLLREHYEQR